MLTDMKNFNPKPKTIDDLKKMTKLQQALLADNKLDFQNILVFKKTTGIKMISEQLNIHE